MACGRKSVSPFLRWPRLLLVALAALAGVLLSLGSPPSASAAITQTFTCNGAEQTLVVPAGVTSIHVVAYGGAGRLVGDVFGARGGDRQGWEEPAGSAPQDQLVPLAGRGYFGDGATCALPSRCNAGGEYVQVTAP